MGQVGTTRWVDGDESDKKRRISKGCNQTSHINVATINVDDFPVILTMRSGAVVTAVSSDIEGSHFEANHWPFYVYDFKNKFWLFSMFCFTIDMKILTDK